MEFRSGGGAGQPDQDAQAADVRPGRVLTPAKTGPPRVTTSTHRHPITKILPEPTSSTKSRRYSTTLGDLRGVRAVHRATEARERYGLPTLGDETTLVLGHWRFAGSGYSPGEAIMAEHIRRKVATARKIATEREDG